MHLTAGRAAALAATATVALAAPVAMGSQPGAHAAAKSRTVDMQLSGGKSQTATSIKDVVAKGKPYGTCSVDAVFKKGTNNQTWTCKGGTFKATFGYKITGASAKGNPRFHSGTGKFKDISGTVSFTLNLSTNVGRMTGTVKY